MKAYRHNGYFRNLKDVMHFYTTRDVLPRCEATISAKVSLAGRRREDAANMNTRQLGNVGLSDDEENAIVTFLRPYRMATSGLTSPTAFPAAGPLPRQRSDRAPTSRAWNSLAQFLRLSDRERR